MNKLTIILIAVALVPVMTVYADHVDNNMWIETAEGSFVYASEVVINQIDSNTKGSYDSRYYQCSFETYPSVGYMYSENERYLFSLPEISDINRYEMFDQREGECGISKNEQDYLIKTMESEKILYRPHYQNILIGYYYEDEIIASNKELPHKAHHECACGYWYSNTIQDEYTYTIIDLPRDRELPPNYKHIVSTGIQAGFDRWGEINDIDFRYTDSRLQADIIVQQQIGDGRAYGNANLGCLFDEEQCTIQLFSDMNIGKRQTLVNAKSIEWTVAHEFGHLIGLPHHIEPDHIMNTVHANDVRDYWEARNINVPRMTEPTHEQRLLENDNDYLDYANYIPTDMDGIMKHSAVTEFVEFMKAVMYNMTESNRVLLWTDMVEQLANAIFS